MKSPRKSTAPSENDRWNAGLLAYIEWGPQRSKPDEQRVAEAMPGVSSAQIAELVEEFGRIDSAAHRIVIEMLEQKLGEEIGRRRVAEIDPRLSADNAAMLFTQARVSAWRDGYS